MRVSRILALLFLCVASCCAQNGYSTTYTWGVSDLSGRMSNTNLWYPLGHSGVCNIPAMGYDGTFYCAQNGTPTPSSLNAVDYFDQPTQTWKQIDGIGHGIMGLAVVSQNNLYILKTVASCPSPYYGVYHWDGTTLTFLNGCALSISAGEDGTALVVGGSNTLWKYTGTTWIEMRSDSGWTSSSVANMNDMCGVKNGLIYWYDSDDSDGIAGSWVQVSSPPASNLVYTCHIENDSNSGMGMFSMYRSTNNHGQYITLFAYYDFASGTWTNVQMPASGMIAASSIGKWPTIALDSAGHPYHFNVYGVYHAATITGSVNQCPPPNPCNPTNVTHNGLVRATLTGGLYGTQASGNYAPSANMNITSYDITATGCDSLFSDPTQCIPVDTGSVQCSQSGFLFTGTPSNGQPPEPQTHWAEYVGGFDSFFVNYKNDPIVWPDGTSGFRAESLAGDTDNACAYGTYSLCQPPYGGDTVTITTGCKGPLCTPGVAKAKAEYEANIHKKSTGTVWGVFFNYTKGLTSSCVKVTVWDEKPNTPCY